MKTISLINIFFPLIFAPFLFGVINRTKAFFAGRAGQPLLQAYFDIWKLFKKSAVYSQTTTWVFRCGPLVGFASVLICLLLLPFAGFSAPLSFQGDLVLLAYLLGLLRYFMVIAALDTGSSFEGMGSSREVQFSALAEPALLLGLGAIARETGSFSLSSMFSSISIDLWLNAGPALALVTAAFFIVFLTENARIPVDDPNTHLELTMIHEVMVLDHSGPDFGLILYTSTLKLWILGSFIVGLLIPVHTGNFFYDGMAYIAGMFGIAIITGIIESVIARLRLLHVPQLLVGAGVLSVMALILVLR